MKTPILGDLRVIGSAVGDRRPGLAVVVLLSVLTFVFDGLAIVMLVPLLADLQGLGTTGAAATPFRGWLDLTWMVPERWRVQVMLAVIVASTAIKNGLIFAGTSEAHRLSTGLVAELRRILCRRFLRAGLEFHDQSRTSDHLDRAINHTMATEELLRISLEFFTNAMTLLALAAILFFLSWPLALISVALGGLSLVGGLAYARGMSRLGAADASATRAMVAGLHEMLAAIRLIKASSTEARHAEDIDRKINGSRDAAFKRTIFAFAIHPITDVTATTAMAGIFLAALWINGGDARVMLVRSLPFMFVLLRIVPLLKILNGQKAVIFSRLPNLHSVAEALRTTEQPAIPDGHLPFPGLRREIRLEGVTYTYRGRNQPALSSIDLVIPAGRTTAIIGESGSGKSTLVNLIQRLYDPQAGEIWIDGRPLRDFQLESYHRRIGCVAQDTFLFHQSIRFNIAYGAAEPVSDDRLIEAAKRACAHNFIMDLPAGYDTMVGDRGVRFSGGQRQRLALARAIVADPEILIFDEATSALDVETERAIHEAIREFSRDRTVIIISHRPQTVQDADRIVVMRHGEVVSAGAARMHAV